MRLSATLRNNARKDGVPCSVQPAAVILGGFCDRLLVNLCNKAKARALGRFGLPKANLVTSTKAKGAAIRINTRKGLAEVI